jgi:hypothetical protein
MLNLLWGGKESSSGNQIASRRRPPARKKTARRLELERLEERSLMATSSWVTLGQDGHLIYRPTANGDRIPDFTNVGYQGGHKPIPTDLPVQAVVSPQEGDDGAAIQAAIDAVSILPLDASGFRGVVQLEAGEYQIAGQINVWASGVVLRGAGDGLDGTVLRATGTDRRSLVNIAGTSWRQAVPGTLHTVVNPYVPVGARSFQVESTAGLDVGDTVVVHRPSTDAWIRAIGMHKLKNPWQPGTKDLLFDRVITRIEGNWITVDAPLTNSLDEKYGGATVYEYSWDTRLENIGVEHLRGVSDYAYATDENHSWTFVEILASQNVWVRDITTLHFAYAAVNARGNSKWVTVEDAVFLDPKSLVTGGRRYPFHVEGQQMLVRNAYAKGGRHDFVVGGMAVGPNVFVDCRSDGALSDSGPHHRWSVGTLFDNVQVFGNQLNIRNRGNSGTGHGWTAANSVVWNSRASKGFIVESPPTAQNWLIGSSGSIAKNSFAVGSKPAGIKDSHGKAVTPRSLFDAQLQERQRLPGLAQREYWLGDIDQFRSAGVEATTAVWSDSAWLDEVSAAATGRVMGLDKTTTNTWVPLSFNFELAPGEQVVSATLSLSLRATAASVSANRVYFDGLDASRTVSQLGWGSISRSGTTPRTVDLTPYLNALADGQFNLALNNDLAVDWAVLNIQVGPGGYDTTPTLIAASHDAQVLGGASADLNFGAEAWMGAMAATSVYAQRESFVSFDISSLAGQTVHAVVRLPILTAAPTVCNSAAVAVGDWDESTITWNNKPVSGETLATWSGTAGGFASIDVTPHLNHLLAGGYTRLSLRIFACAGSGMLTYGSSEGDPLTQPLLEVYAL